MGIWDCMHVSAVSVYELLQHAALLPWCDGAAHTYFGLSVVCTCSVGLVLRFITCYLINTDI